MANSAASLNLHFFRILACCAHSSGFIQKASEFCRSFVFWLFSHFSTSGDPTQGANSPIFCGFEFIAHTKNFLGWYILKIAILHNVHEFFFWYVLHQKSEQMWLVTSFRVTKVDTSGTKMNPELRNFLIWHHLRQKRAVCYVGLFTQLLITIY